MKRERNFNGDWGYCRNCGHKAYETLSHNKGVYSLCAYQCGFIRTFQQIVYQRKNTEKFDWQYYHDECRAYMED